MVCPKCGAENSNIQQSKNNLWHTFLIIGFIIIIMIGVVGCSSKTDIKITVWIEAQDTVKEHLKAPSTADFPADYEKYITDNGDGTYKIKAYVDSENSFGAKIRSNFSLTIKQDEDGYSYKELIIKSE